MSARGIYRILRLPLFTTAVADAVAGYFVARLPDLDRVEPYRVLLLAGVSTGLYLFGMVENDLADVRRDRRLAPDRPLVRGEVSVATAVVLLVLTAILAGACAVSLSAGALVLAIGAFAAINLYNLAAKRGPASVAMVMMGLCRLLNFGIGVAAASGVPHAITPDLFGPTGPLWARHGLAIFFATVIVTGYSIAARRGHTVSSRPWSAAFFAAAVAGFAMIAIQVGTGVGWFHAPLARVFAGLLLAALWPGALWSAAGAARRPEQYARFITRMLYWFIIMDAAFVLDRLLVVM